MLWKRKRLLGAILLLLLLGLLSTQTVLAQDPPQQTEDNENCLICHGRSNLQFQFSNGEPLNLHISPEIYEDSVHGEEEITCIECHTDTGLYPHNPIEANTRRLYQIEQYRLCKECHEEVYEDSLDSMHAQELAGGNWDAAICTDCHGAHDTMPTGESHTKIPQTCSQCHSGIYNEYQESVHGEALIDEDNTDAPTCTDCHGTHTQEDPRTTSFRLHSPSLCATCHADEELMNKYNISTHVFDTYVADFHGTTVTIFERQSPDLPTNKAVCYDCHGVHNMKSADDPEAQTFQNNLLDTCQKCHPDATENFSASWLSHYEPNVEKYPLVYFVDLFYKILIPAVLGFMVLFVLADVGSRFIHHTSQIKKKEEQS